MTKNELARKLHNADTFHSFDKAAALWAMSWISKMERANVQNGREVAAAINNVPSAAAYAYEINPTKFDKMFAAFTEWKKGR